MSKMKGIGDRGNGGGGRGGGRVIGHGEEEEDGGTASIKEEMAEIRPREGAKIWKLTDTM